MREYPASAGQRLLWFLGHHASDAGLLCPLLCRIRGRIDAGTLEAAVATLTRRHGSLRTTFSGRGRRLMQVVHDAEVPPPPVAVIDLSGSPDPAAALRAAVASELAEPVDVSAWPTRTTVWQLGPADHALAFSMHHLVSDSWSCGVLFRELAVLLDEREGELEPVGWQYPAFAEWQQSALVDGELRPQVDYWHRRLAGCVPPRLPLRPRGEAARGQRAVAQAHLDADTTARLHRLAREQRTTPFAALLAVYDAVLQEATGESDLAVASLMANRVRPELRSTVGFVANLVVLRTRLRRHATFLDVLRAADATAGEAFINQGVPLHVVPQASLERDGVRAQDVVLQLMPEPIQQTVHAGGVELEGIVPEDLGRFDFELALVPSGGGLHALLYHDSGRLPAGYAEEFVARFVEAARAAAANPHRRTDRLAG
ncbi:MAG: condensation protein [Actinobacteria bacterium]|nr:condensation protein [Actinomycetota bacterium]